MITDETRKKLRESHLGQKAWNKGIPMSEKAKKKLSLANKGKVGYKGFKGIHLSPSSEFKKGIIPWNKGIKGLVPWNKGLTKEIDSRLNYERPTMFKDQGKCDENMRIRKSRQSLLWRKAIFERDNYICQECGQRGGKLNADHIKPFSLYPKLRFDLSNGRTLCKDCHLRTDTYGGKILRFKTDGTGGLVTDLLIEGFYTQ